MTETLPKNSTGIERKGSKTQQVEIKQETATRDQAWRRVELRLTVVVAMEVEVEARTEETQEVGAVEEGQLVVHADFDSRIRMKLQVAVEVDQEAEEGAEETEQRGEEEGGERVGEAMVHVVKVQVTVTGEARIASNTLH